LVEVIEAAEDKEGYFLEKDNLRFEKVITKRNHFKNDVIIATAQIPSYAYDYSAFFYYHFIGIALALVPGKL